MQYFFTSSIKDCQVALYVLLSTCCVLPQMQLQCPVNDPARTLVPSVIFVEKILFSLFECRTAIISYSAMVCSKQPTNSSSMKILSHGQINYEEEGLTFSFISTSYLPKQLQHVHSPSRKVKTSSILLWNKLAWTFNIRASIPTRKSGAAMLIQQSINIHYN